MLYIEDGIIIFIGVIIENSSFEFNSVLFFRVRVYLLKFLSIEDIE